MDKGDETEGRKTQGKGGRGWKKEVEQRVEKHRARVEGVDKQGGTEGGKTQGKGGRGWIKEVEQRVEKHRVRVEEGG